MVDDFLKEELAKTRVMREHFANEVRNVKIINELKGLLDSCKDNDNEVKSLLVIKRNGKHYTYEELENLAERVALVGEIEVIKMRCEIEMLHTKERFLERLINESILKMGITNVTND